MRPCLASLALLALAACGDDRRVVDAGTVDAAGVDAPSPDADIAERCMTLCECAVASCATDFPDLAACLTDCATLDESVKLCRIEHCGYAQTNPGLHCPHVAGDPNAGVPACVQP